MTFGRGLYIVSDQQDFELGRVVGDYAVGFAVAGIEDVFDTPEEAVAALMSRHAQACAADESHPDGTATTRW